MYTEFHKFYLVGAAGGNTPTADELFYHWAVIHPTMMLATEALMKNFRRYSQNYCNHDVPDEARLIRRHPTWHLRILSYHWANSWENIEASIEDPSHRSRLGRHVFGDQSSIRCFFGRGSPVYKSTDFQHPAALTISHWLGLRLGDTRAEAVQRLKKHKALLAFVLQELGRDVKYSVGICDEDQVKRIESSRLASFPWEGYFAVELIQFQVKEDGFDFVERYKNELVASYAEFIDLETSYSIYGVERVVFDFTDESQSLTNELWLGDSLTDFAQILLRKHHYPCSSRLSTPANIKYSMRIGNRTCRHLIC